MKATISELIKYPLKSGTKVPVDQSQVTKIGLENDRKFAVIDADRKVLTGRECQALLHVQLSVSANQITLASKGHESCTEIIDHTSTSATEVNLFNDTVHGTLLSEKIAEWLSSVLGQPSELIALNDSYRSVKSKYGGLPDDVVSYADASPIHLINEASIEDLNSKLKEPITLHHFRPNIVVQGVEAFEEDGWKLIQIGECQFEVHHHCKRCVFTTINPENGEKSMDSEPLKTLSKYRKMDDGGVYFGVYLIPRKLGHISVNDVLQVIE